MGGGRYDVDELWNESTGQATFQIDRAVIERQFAVGAVSVDEACDPQTILAGEDALVTRARGRVAHKGTHPFIRRTLSALGNGLAGGGKQRFGAVIGRAAKGDTRPQRYEDAARAFSTSSHRSTPPEYRSYP